MSSGLTLGNDKSGSAKGDWALVLIFSVGVMLEDNKSHTMHVIRRTIRM